jgi:hypothetical protein
MEESEVVKKIQEAADFHAKSLVAIVRAIEKNYGEKSKALVREAWLEDVYNKPWKKIGKSVGKNDVQTLTKLIEEGCFGTHEWEKVVDKPNNVAYRFMKCRWAEIFRELGATDIGKWFCDSDLIYVKAFNPKMKFKRTKTLMGGHNCCDHVFYME